MDIVTRKIPPVPAEVLHEIQVTLTETQVRYLLGVLMAIDWYEQPDDLRAFLRDFYTGVQRSTGLPHIDAESFDFVPKFAG